MMDRNNLTPLVERSRAGDRAAQEQLVSAVQNYVYFHCCKLLAHRENALDVTQEVLIAMVTGLPKLQEPAAFWSWLLRIIYTRCKNHQMRGPKECQIPETAEGSSLLDLQTEDSPEAIPEQALDNAETVRILRELVDGLSADQRVCVLLYYYDELKIAEIASVLSVPESTVKNRLYHARRALKAGIVRYEQHSGKLYTLSLAPLLGYLLRSEAEAGTVPAAEQAALTASALSAGASTAGGAALWLKIAAGVAALGITVGGIWMARDLRKTKPPVEIVKETSVPVTAAEAFPAEDLAVLQDYLQEQCMVDDGLALTDCNGDGQWELLCSGMGDALGEYQLILTVENGEVVCRDLNQDQPYSESRVLGGFLVTRDRETGRTLPGRVHSDRADGGQVTLTLFPLDDGFTQETPVTWTGTEEELVNHLGRERTGTTVLEWYLPNQDFTALAKAFPERTVGDNLDLLQFPQETVSFWDGDLVLEAPSFWLEDVEYAEGRNPEEDWPTVTFWSSANRLEGDDNLGFLLRLEQTSLVSHALAQELCGPGGSIPGSLGGYAVLQAEPTDYRAYSATDQYNQDQAVALAVCDRIAWEPESLLPEKVEAVPPDIAAYGAWVLENVLTDHTLTFDSPLELDDDTLLLMAGCWTKDALQYEIGDGDYDYPEPVILEAIDLHWREYDFDITRCSGYDSETKLVRWETPPYRGTLDMTPVDTEVIGNGLTRYWFHVTLTDDGGTLWEGRKGYTIGYDHNGWYYQSVTLAEEGGDMARLTDALAQVTGVSSGDPLTQFYHYYNTPDHLRELSMLPELDGTGADWDDLTLYIYNNAQRQSDGTLTRQDFADTVERLLGNLPYEDHSSRYLTYEDGIYRPVPGDSMWSGYYRLTDLSVDDDGIYTAAFDVLIFDELEYTNSYESLGPNMQYILDTAGVTDYEDMMGGVLEKTILNIFWYDNYNEVLDMTEHVEIQFRLSGDPTYPLTYLSCTSEPDDRTMY